MNQELTARPDWEIDRILATLKGEDIRVAARAFAPKRRIAEALHLIPVRELFLPDGSRPDGVPVWFEGRLERYERRIGVVWIWLQAPRSPEAGANGLVCFRGNTAIILRGPAVVELAFPFQVERLPADPENYWRDLRVPRAQFEFTLGTEVNVPVVRYRCAPSPVGLGAIPLSEVSSGPSPERCLAPVDSPERVAVDQPHGGTAVRGDNASHCEDQSKQRFTTRTVRVQQDAGRNL